MQPISCCLHYLYSMAIRSASMCVCGVWVCGCACGWVGVGGCAHIHVSTDRLLHTIHSLVGCNLQICSKRHIVQRELLKEQEQDKNVAEKFVLLLSAHVVLGPLLLVKLTL